MDGSVLHGDPGHAPGWAEVRAAVVRAAEACAAAVAGMSVRGGDRGAIRTAQEAVAALRDLGGCLRYAAFDEAVVDAERARAADEALAAAGLVPPPRRGGHLHAVS
jgi:hypothetical protein